jgi:hypothetical protein
MKILQSSNMTGFELRTMVINADTIAQARTTKRNLWFEARTDPDIILLSPEELGSRESNSSTTLLSGRVLLVCVFLSRVVLRFFEGGST